MTLQHSTVGELTKGKVLSRPGKNHIKDAGSHVAIPLSARTERLVEIAMTHYLRQHGRTFEELTIVRGDGFNRSTAYQIVLEDWLQALQAGEKADADTLRVELEEYAVAASAHPKRDTRVYFNTEGEARFKDLQEALAADRKSLIHGRAAMRTMLLIVALARYVRVRVGVDLGMKELPPDKKR